jgi:hypothetical protein
VGQFINGTADLVENGPDKVKGAFDKGITTGEGALSLGEGLAKATQAGRIAAVLDPHNSTENRITSLALAAVSVNPFINAATWFLPAPKLKTTSSVQGYCIGKLNDRPLLDVLSKGNPGTISYQDFKNMSKAETERAAAASEAYFEAVVGLAPCFSSDADYDILKQVPVFGRNEAGDFAYSKHLIKKAQRAVDIRGHNPLVNYEYDLLKAYDPGFYDEGRRKVILKRFDREQESMVSSEYLERLLPWNW